MAKKKESTTGDVVASLVWIGFLIAWLFTDTSFWWMAGIGLVVGVAVGIAIDSGEKKAAEAKKSQRRQTALDMVVSNVEEYMQTLVRKRRTLVRTGDYGEIIDDAWRKEIIKFLKATTPAEVYDLMDVESNEGLFLLTDFVDSLVLDKCEQDFDAVDEVDVSEFEGIEYEGYCAAILEEHGWKVTRTPVTGDHGIDLIAEKPGRRVAIQCKRYNSPVGNKAVQEAYAGMAFFEADKAVVVSNAPFTSAAKQIGSKLSVSLVHHDQLTEL